MEEKSSPAVSAPQVQHNKPRNISTVTPPIDNPLYKIASRNLRNLNPPLHISPSDLGKFFVLLDLPCRRLLRKELVTMDQIKQHVSKDMGADHDWTDSNIQGEADDNSVSDEEEHAKSEAKDTTASGVSEIEVKPIKGPVTTFLKIHGIEFGPEKLARLMHVLSTPPRMFVQKGFITSESIHVPKEEELLNEIHFYRRLASKKQVEKASHPPTAETSHSVINIHHHYYNMCSSGTGNPRNPSYEDLGDYGPETGPVFHHYPPAPFHHPHHYLNDNEGPSPRHGWGRRRGGRFGPGNRGGGGGHNGKPGYSTDNA